MHTIHIFHILLGIYYLCLYVNCEWIENKGLWYYISPSEEAVDYHEATASCTSINSRLAVLTDEDQNYFIGDNIKDDTKRWIGLSNIKTQDYYEESCNGQNFFWNYDLFCKSGYDIYEYLHDCPETDRCMGVVITRDGSWKANNCENTFGFICQWECKRLYIQFETLNLYSGSYMLYFYWNGHIAYVKTDTDMYVEIYKENGYWLLGSFLGEKYTVIATFTSESHVPYGNSTSWVRGDDKYIGFASLCIDCDRLSLFVDTYNNERIDYDDIKLANYTAPYPAYADIKHSAIIYYNAAIFTYCIEIQIPGRANRVYYCDYIFPYPDETLIFKTDDEYTVYINNVCIAGHESVSTNSVFSTSQSIDEPAKLSESTTGSRLRIHEYTSTTIIIQTNSSGLFAPLGDEVDSKTVAIAATVSVLLITVIVIIVIVSVFGVRRKRHKKERHNKFRNKNTPIRDAQANPNIYLELDGSTAATTLNDYQGLQSNAGEYSYANILGHSPKSVVDSTTQTKQAPSNRPAPFEGYLAPDYGVLNAQRVSQTDKVDTNVISDAVRAVYCEAKAPKGSPTHKEADHNKSAESQNAKKNAKFDSDEDLQLQENEVYVETVDNNQ